MFWLAVLIAPALDGGAEPAEPEVQQLVTRARAGEADAARQLYAAYATVVFRTVRPMCRSEADAEDLVQDTFTKALSALDRYEPRAGKRFVSWLLTIALNTARKVGRRYHGRVAATAPQQLDRLREREAATSDDPAGAGLDLQRRRSVLLRLLGELRDRDREIVTLRYAGELSVAEVAEASGEKPANVRKICERTRRRLLERMEAELAEEPLAADRVQDPQEMQR